MHQRQNPAGDKGKVNIEIDKLNDKFDLIVPETLILPPHPTQPPP